MQLFIKNYSDSSKANIDKKIHLEDMINASNGSPGQILHNIKIWNEIPEEIKDNLNFPLSDNLEILKISKIISEKLEIDQQLFLINLLQKRYWETTKKKKIITKLEDLKVNLKNFIQPRLAWEVALLKIAMEDL